MNSVLLLGEGFTGPLREAVLAACARAQRGVVECPHAGAVLPPGVEPDTVLAVLPSGARSVPAALTALVEHLPGPPVLALLCHEPLAKPLVELDGGRLRLAGSPLSPERISQLLGMAAPHQPRRTIAGGGVGVREFRGPGWWGAALWRADGPEPLVEDHGPRGALALACSGGTSGSAGSSITGSDDGEARLGSLADGRSEGVGLLLDQQSWRLCAAGTVGGATAPLANQVWIRSSARLPGQWRLRGRSRRLAAVPGDVAVGLVGDEAGDLSAVRCGADLLDRLEQRMLQGGSLRQGDSLRPGSSLRAAVIVELRP